MAKDYLKVCENIEEYTNFKFSEEFALPNVTLVEDGKELHLIDENNYTNGHKYVDLGLPSGTLWATKNVGADSEKDFGLFFAWGETEGYSRDSNHVFDEANYTMNNEYQLGSEVLKFTHDAAQKSMGGLWHIPTDKQIEELMNNCQISSITKESASSPTIDYYELTSKIDTTKKIYFPAGCTKDGSNEIQLGTNCIWSSNNLDKNPNFATILTTKTSSQDITLGTDAIKRCMGMQVRGVIEKNKNN